MKQYPKPLAKLIGELSKLPGIGYKSAQRLAFHILDYDERQAQALADAITCAKREMTHCSICGNLTDRDPCAICADDSRRRDVICVVESPRDVAAMERIREFDGTYHVLGGVISPIQGISPSDLHVDLLTDNIRRLGVREVILALGTTIEGETTSYYLTKKLQPLGVVVSVISRGIGFGDELEYADELTITHALRNRQPL